jgi:hypothetical protein
MPAPPRSIHGPNACTALRILRSARLLRGGSRGDSVLRLGPPLGPKAVIGLPRTLQHRSFCTHPHWFYYSVKFNELGKMQDFRRKWGVAPSVIT